MLLLFIRIFIKKIIIYNKRKYISVQNQYDLKAILYNNLYYKIHDGFQ